MVRGIGRRREPEMAVRLTSMARVQQVSLGYNTVYVVEGGDDRVLIDTGPDYRGATEQIERALGNRLPDVVVATHGHLDHAGLGRWWEERGVPVALGEDDFHFTSGPQLASEIEWGGFVRFIERSGAPPEVRTEVLGGLKARREWSKNAATGNDYPPPGRERRWPTGLRYHPFQPSIPLRENGPLGETTLEVLMCPGHTPGNVVVIDRAEGWLFSGDQLLPDMTPTPGVQVSPAAGADGDWRFRSLPRFVSSLRQLAELDLTRCYPGHGEPFDDVRGAVLSNLLQVEQRSQRVLDALRAEGPTTLFGICERLYPRAVQRRFWQIAATVQGHLDLLEEAGQVLPEETLFRAA
jgi:glyoxylase-like metal-dependent hydrolase (beta-lactamase superfamily II)